MASDSEPVILLGSLSMSEPVKAVFDLVPEIALLASLPEHLRKRFTHALQQMHADIDESHTWEQIATQSAISPYHFHRQFTELFNETPGQYMGRLRLQVAVNRLLNEPSGSILDIAQQCGFSTSQSLAKALKRELGVTAKTIRKMGVKCTPQETSDFIAKLSHPGSSVSLEAELAQSMPTERIWYPKRGIKKVTLDNPDWDSVFESHGKKSVRLLAATPIDQLERSWEDIETFIGDWQVDEVQYDFFIPEGYYLCADIYLLSDVAYGAALEALFDIAKQQQLEVDPQAFLIEMVRDIELTLTGGVTFSFQLPIR